MKNEQVAHPEVSIANTDLQSATMPVAESVAYTYERADGTIERARSAEDALARCPVLGRLAIEAPEQANILLELAAAGQEKMAETTTENVVKQSEAEPSIKAVLEATTPREPAIKGDAKLPAKPTPTSPRIEAILKPEPINEPTAIEQSAHKPVPAPQEEHMNIGISAIEQEQTKKDTPAQTPEYEQLTETPREVTPVEKYETFLQRAENQHTAEAATDTVQQVDLLNASHESIESMAKAQQEPVLQIVRIDEATDNEESAEKHTMEASDNISEAVHTYDISQDDAEPSFIELPADNETGPSALVDVTVKHEETPYEPKTIEVFQQLLAIAGDTHDKEPVDFDLQAAETNQMRTTDIFEDIPTLDVEIFIARQPINEAPDLFESITEQSNERPLELTLAQLATHSSESQVTDEKDVMTEISAMIDEVMQVYLSEQEANDEEACQPINIELTEALIALLGKLGYEDPDEVLVNFVEKHSFPLLLQTLLYIYHINHEDNRQEFLITSAATTASHESTRQRLGKVLFGLIVKTYAKA